MKKETEKWTENLLQLLYEWMHLLQKESDNIIERRPVMGYKILNQDKREQVAENNSLTDDFKLTDVTKEELDKRRIPVYSYLM